MSGLPLTYPAAAHRDVLTTVIYLNEVVSRRPRFEDPAARVLLVVASLGTSGVEVLS